MTGPGTLRHRLTLEEVQRVSDGAGGFTVEHEIEGDSIAEVLSYVEYDPQDCLAAFRKRVDGAVAQRDVSAEERRLLISAYKDSLAGYTYFE